MLRHTIFLILVSVPLTTTFAPFCSAGGRMFLAQSSGFNGIPELINSGMWRPSCSGARTQPRTATHSPWTTRGCVHRERRKSRAAAGFRMEAAAGALGGELVPTLVIGPACISSAAAARDRGAAVAAALRADGIVRVNGAITSGMASDLLKWVNASLDDALQETREDTDFGAQWQLHFASVRQQTNRHDIKLDLEAPPVRAALTAMLSSLQPAIADILGEDAQLYELASLVSLPGAVRQPVHPDTPIVATKGTDQGATILTAFVALQDVDASMGPTLFLPATHTAEAHAAFFTYDNFEVRPIFKPETCIFNPKPRTLNPKLQTLNPKPQTLNPKPKHKTLNHKPSTLNPTP